MKYLLYCLSNFSDRPPPLSRVEMWGRIHISYQLLISPIKQLKVSPGWPGGEEGLKQPSLDSCAVFIYYETYILCNIIYEYMKLNPRWTGDEEGSKQPSSDFSAPQNLSLFLRVLWWPEIMAGALRLWLSFVLCFQHVSHLCNLCASSPPPSTRI